MILQSFSRMVKLEYQSCEEIMLSVCPLSNIQAGREIKLHSVSAFMA
jgi:adenosine deaminase